MESSPWKQGDIHPETGLVYWSKQASCKNGERWMTPKKFNEKKEKIKAHVKTKAGRDAIKKRRNTDTERAKRNAYARVWTKSPEQKAKMAALMRKRRRENALVSLAERVRARTSEAIRRQGYTKRSATNTIVGCEWITLYTHIESMFLEGMSWENRSEWEIDHIIPLSCASTEEELLVLSHDRNLQPLWKTDNRRKGAKLI
jgi:hypothetical protein